MKPRDGWSAGKVARGDVKRCATYQEALSVVRNDCRQQGGGRWYQWDDLQQHVLYGEEVYPMDGAFRVLTEEELRAREEEGGPA